MLENLQGLWAQIQANLAFLAVCVLICAGLGLVAWLLERYLPGRRTISPTRRVTIVAVCAALAALLQLWDFPLPFLAPDFYKVDFSEVPLMLCGMYIGPTAVVVGEAVKTLLKLLLKGTSTAFVGEFANFVVGCAYALPAAIVYQVAHTRKGAYWGLAMGTAVMTVFGSLFNAFFLLPKFAELYGMPLDAILAMGTAINPAITGLGSFVALAVAPLNFLKGLVVSLLTALLYKKVARPLFGKE